MQRISFTHPVPSKASIAILGKINILSVKEMTDHYVSKLNAGGISSDNILAYDLKYDDKDVKALTIKDYLENELLPQLAQDRVELLMVADSKYFKKLAGVTKVDPELGYLKECKIKNYEFLKVVYLPNHKQIFYNPEIRNKIQLACSAVSAWSNNTYSALGNDIIKYSAYPTGLSSIVDHLKKIFNKPILVVDVETFSLKLNEVGIGTISFAWSQHEGIAFGVDLSGGYKIKNIPLRAALKDFFTNYKGKIIAHNANFDFKVLINELFVQDKQEQNTVTQEINPKKIIEGINCLTKDFEDTLIMAYLATNSTAGNELSLKVLAHEFAGNYAVDEIDDILKVPFPKLLQYNLIDTLCTFYVYNKFKQKLIDDHQEQIYNTIFKPSVKVILQMELVGMPINLQEVAKTKKELKEISLSLLANVRNDPDVIKALYQEKSLKAAKDNLTLKSKVRQPEDFDYEFNLNSPIQLQNLFYDYWKLPVLDLTDKKKPAVGGKTIKKLIAHAKDPRIKETLSNIKKFKDADKILSTFIKAFEENSWNSKLPDGKIYEFLHGNFRLGGTVSGRLSSSKPNLQNMPSGSTYGKLIKNCFQAPPGWLFVGADFASLEDRISALTTKDPNKIKIYEDGFDGHSLRAYNYWPEKFPNIDPNSVESINSIQETHPDIRSDSKAPTFLLTYQGTYMGLMTNCGFDEAEAKLIEQRYHDMHKVSDAWVQDKLTQATKDGYVTVAFGLRVRTPILEKTVLNSGFTPKQAQGEARTAGNALGQSYGMLNNRAAIELQERTLASPYKYDILPVAHIHDAQYFLIKDDIKVVEWLNNNLVECMEWQELPEIQHPNVKLGGNLDIFYPSWAKTIKLPNKATTDQIRDLCKQSMKG